MQPLWETRNLNEQYYPQIKKEKLEIVFKKRISPQTQFPAKCLLYGILSQFFI